MRLNRFLYASLLILAFIFVYFYGGKVPYMLFYTVLALPVISVLYIFIGYFGLKCEQISDSNSVIKGDRVSYTLSITNRSLFFLPYVKIKLFGNSGAFLEQPGIRNIFIQPFSKEVYNYEYQCRYRGCYEFGLSAVEIQDFLGIFKLTFRKKHPLILTIHPRIIDINSFYLNNDYVPEHMANTGRLYEDISVIEDINKYNYGDSLKKVHWKLTAKVNELMVKKFQNTAAASITFIVDLNRNNFTLERKDALEDKHIEVVVAVLRRCLLNGAAVRLVYYNGEIKTIQCNSLLDFEAVYQVLTKIEFNQETHLQDIIASQMNYNIKKPDILLSTSNIDYGLYETLCKVNASGFDVSLFYLSPDEITGKSGDSAQILFALKAIGIKIYSINISNDIKSVLEYRGG
jgi:uncharacterized protein (DUF58 family)